MYVCRYMCMHIYLYIYIYILILIMYTHNIYVYKYMIIILHVYIYIYTYSDIMGSMPKMLEAAFPTHTLHALYANLLLYWGKLYWSDNPLVLDDSRLSSQIQL